MRSLVRRKNGSHWFDDFKFYRPIFFTGVLNDRLGYGEGDFVIDDIVKNNRHFMNELHRRVYKKSKTKIPRLIVIERGKGRFHTHMILETPEHISNENYRHLIQHSWLKSRDGISVSIEDVTDIKGIKNYLSKEVSLHSVTGVDVKNSYNYL
jgi:hypothetical protein